MKAILLEPDKILARNYASSFKDIGFEVVVFSDPQKAVEYMDESMPSIIIMELQLAPFSGVAFLHELRGYEDFASIPIVVYSSVPKQSFNIDNRGWSSLGVIKYYYKARTSSDRVASFAKGYLSEDA